MKKWLKYALKFLPALLIIPLFVFMLQLSTNMDAPSESLAYALQIENKLNDVQDSLNELETRLFPQDDAFSSMSCEFGSFDAEKKTIPISLTFQPSARYAEIREAVLHCNDKNTPLTWQSGQFITSFSCKLFEMQNISAVTFLDGELAKTVLFSWIIDPSSQVVPQIISVSMLNTNEKDVRGLSYSGILHVAVVSFPEKMGEIKEINLIERSNSGEELSRPIQHQFQNIFSDSFTINKKISGHIKDGSSLEWIIELVDEYGLHYHRSMQRIDSEGNGLWEELNQTRVYDSAGVLLYDNSKNGISPSA